MIDVDRLKGAQASIMLVVLLDTLTSSANTWGVRALMRRTGYKSPNSIYPALDNLTQAPTAYLVRLPNDLHGEAVYGLADTFRQLPNQTLQLPAADLLIENRPAHPIRPSPARHKGAQAQPSQDPAVTALADAILAQVPGSRGPVESKLAEALAARPEADLMAEAMAWAKYARSARPILGAPWVAGQLRDRVPVPVELTLDEAADSGQRYDGYLRSDD